MWLCQFEFFFFFFNCKGQKQSLPNPSKMKFSERDLEASERRGTRMAVRILVLGTKNRWRVSSWRGPGNYSAPATNNLWVPWDRIRIGQGGVSLVQNESVFISCLGKQEPQD